MTSRNWLACRGLRAMVLVAVMAAFAWPGLTYANAEYTGNSAALTSCQRMPDAEGGQAAKLLKEGSPFNQVLPTDKSWDLDTGFQDWAWGSHPQDIDGIRPLADISSDLKVFIADLDLTGQVTALGSPRLVFSKTDGLVLIHVDFRQKDYDLIQKGLTEMLGEPDHDPRVYELLKSQADFGEEAVWWKGKNTQVVLASDGEETYLEISKRGYFLPADGSLNSMLDTAVLKQAEKLDRRNQVLEASSTYQALLNSTEAYADFTAAAQQHLVEYSLEEDAVDFLSEVQGVSFYRLENIYNDNQGQHWLRMELNAWARAVLQSKRPADADENDGLTDISAVLCRVRIEPAAGKCVVVEQIWLDGENQIVGSRPAWAPQDTGWPASQITQACEEFLTAWFAFATGTGTPEAVRVPDAVEHNAAVARAAAEASEHNAAGMAYVRQGEYERAVEEFAAAICADPRYIKAYNNRGGVYTLLHKYEEALQDFDQALSLAPDYAKAYNNRAYVRVKLGNYDQAIDDADKAIAIGPEEAVFYDTRGYAYAGKKLYAEALADLNRAIAIDQFLGDAYFHRAEIFDQSGRLRDALHDYGKYIEYAAENKNDENLNTAKLRYTQITQMLPEVEPRE